MTIGQGSLSRNFMYEVEELKKVLRILTRISHGKAQGAAKKPSIRSALQP